MSLIGIIESDLAALTVGVQRALESCAAVDSAAVQIAARATGAGFTGIAQAMSGVRGGVQDLRAQIGTVGVTMAQAHGPVKAAPDQLSPQEEIAVLAPVSEMIATIQGDLLAAITKVAEVQRRTLATLQGGQPGPALARLDAVKQVLVALAQRADLTKQNVAAALAQAGRLGDEGN